MSTSPLRPVQPPSDTLTGVVFEAIKDAIVNKSLAPGCRVSEAALASQLRVSKTPVREALLRLRHIGLVQVTPTGLRVVMPSQSAVQNAYEFRAALERMSAELAAQRSLETTRDEILFAASSSLDCARSGDRSGFRRWDESFHRLVAHSSQNAQLASSIEDCLVLTSVLRVRDIPVSGDSVVCGQEHVRVAEAVAARDARCAADGMQEHVQHVMSMVLAASTDRHDYALQP